LTRLSKAGVPPEKIEEALEKDDPITAIELGKKT
jgi:hypothetical protein